MAHHNNASFCLFLFIYLFIGADAFAPLERFGHSSVLVGEKLYFFGGEVKAFDCLKEVFHLDVSQPFNTASPPFTENGEMVLKSCWGTFLLSKNEQTIFSCGGGTTNVTNYDKFDTSFVYT